MNKHKHAMFYSSPCVVKDSALKGYHVEIEQFLDQNN